MYVHGHSNGKYSLRTHLRASTDTAYIYIQFWVILGGQKIYCYLSVHHWIKSLWVEAIVAITPSPLSSFFLNEFSPISFKGLSLFWLLMHFESQVTSFRIKRFQHNTREGSSPASCSCLFCLAKYPNDQSRFSPASCSIPTQAPRYNDIIFMKK